MKYGVVPPSGDARAAANLADEAKQAAGTAWFLRKIRV